MTNRALHRIIGKKGFPPEEVFARLEAILIQDEDADLKRVRRSVVYLADTLDEITKNIIKANKNWRVVTNAAQTKADRTGG